VKVRIFTTPGPSGIIESIGGPLVPSSSGVTRVNVGTGYIAGFVYKCSFIYDYRRR